MTLLLTLYGGYAFIANTTHDEHPLNYLYVLSSQADGVPDPRLTIERIFADAGPRQNANLGRPHQDLRAVFLAKGNAKHHAREDAIKAALTRHAKASRNGQDLGLSAESYEAALRFAFKLFDDERLQFQGLKAAAE